MAHIWDTLLAPQRFRESSTVKDSTDNRNPFENDYSRIVLSPHFRRLQDKAQVFPYDESDFVRTRLTHSMEVSTFAKGLGLGVENELRERGELQENTRGHISSILSTAGLIHDIGNPPFGHFGEECVRSFFNNDGKKYLENLNDAERKDFTAFDGNAQSFRVLRKLGLSPDEFGYNLTFPVLACIVKYPFSSLEGNKKIKDSVSRRKFGYFQSEREDFERVFATLGLGNRRHPLVFLLEAADDIAYSVSDIEDGCKKGIIDKDIIFAHIRQDLHGEQYTYWIDKLEKIEASIPDGYPNRFALFIQQFRIAAQSHMLVKATQTFMAHYDEIVVGSFDKDLLMNSDAGELRILFKNLGDINFGHESVLKRELVGQSALNFLLHTFAEALFSPNNSSSRSKEYKICKLISSTFRYAVDHNDNYPQEDYKKLRLLIDYISGMTDTYAIKLYHELAGISVS
jgi:dGTPase